MSKTYARRQSRTDPKGDRRSRSISPGEGPLDYTPLEALSDGQLSSDALDAMTFLLTRGDGWLRMTSTLDMKTVYLKYKWTSGGNRGKYVMAVATLGQLAWGLCLLHRKTLQVDQGELRASQDTFYDWKD